MKGFIQRMNKPFIFQITGYQNSGKTTYIKKLIAKLALQNLRVVTLKHHGHGGKPNITEETDSARHIAAGAAASLVEGGGRLLLQAENIAWTLEKKIQLLTVIEPDVILIEGHKYESYPKVVLLRDQTDFHLLEELKNIAAVIYLEHKPLLNLLPVFQRDDPSSINWVIDYIVSQVAK